MYDFRRNSVQGHSGHASMNISSESTNHARNRSVSATTKQNVGNAANDSIDSPVHPLLKKNPTAASGEQSEAKRRTSKPSLAGYNTTLSSHPLTSKDNSTSHASVPNHPKGSEQSSRAQPSSSLSATASPISIPGSEALSPSADPTTVAANLDANLRQLAILQALVARQQELVRASTANTPAGTNGALASSVVASDPSFLAASSSSSAKIDSVAPGTSQDATANRASIFRPEMTRTASYLEAIQQHAAQPAFSRNKSSSSSSTTSSVLDGLNSLIDPDSLSRDQASNSARELAQAQQQLDLWSQISFTSQNNTPSHTNPASPTRYDPTTTTTTTSHPTRFDLFGIAGDRPGTGVNGRSNPTSPMRRATERLDSGNTGANFDWSSFYTDLMSGGDNSHHTSDESTETPPTSLAPSALSETSSSFDMPPPSSSSINSSTSSTTKPRSLSRSNSVSKPTSSTTTVPSKRGSQHRSISPPLIDTSMIDELLEEEFPLRPPLTTGTPEEIEEDKRRRNTEASARFRARKKQRDALLLQTSAQLRERASELEKEKESLVTENQWLRDLVAARKPKSLQLRGQQV